VNGELNASQLCVDRHVGTWRKSKVAIYWEGEPGDTRVLSYSTLHREANRVASALPKMGLRKGDKIAIYLPMIPELVIFMLAAGRIGVTHTVVFRGFSAEGIAHRVNDIGATVVITADGSYRRGSVLPLKETMDEMAAMTPSVEKVVVVKLVGRKVNMQPGRDVWLSDILEGADSYVEPVPVDDALGLARGARSVEDDEGCFWLLGRADEVLKVAGHRIGTLELENAAISFPAVAEGAAASRPDAVKGEAIVVFAILREGHDPSPNLAQRLGQQIRKVVGPVATPDRVFFVQKLPKTRSGKIMRRVLRAVASESPIGDVSTLEDGASVDQVKAAYEELKRQI
jgi:acyl-coenzyme A synthetase/AMP-(fatty) acid ligase